MEHLKSPAAEAERGWTRERQVRFLTLVAEEVDVRRACAAIGLSRQSVYRLRRRNADFAKVWAAALCKAHERKVYRRVVRRLELIEAAERRRAEEAEYWDGPELEPHAETASIGYTSRFESSQPGRVTYTN